MTTILVLNTICDRVIFFTTDESYKPSFSPYTWVVYYDKPLPETITTTNCWSYRLRNNVLEYADDYTLEERGLNWNDILLIRNKKSLKADLHEKIDSLLKSTYRRSPLSLLTLCKEHIDTGNIDPQLAKYADFAKQSPTDLANKLLADDKIIQESVESLELKRFQFELILDRATTQPELETTRRQISGLRS